MLMCPRAQWTEEESQKFPSGALINMASHVGALDYKVWDSMRSKVKFCKCDFYSENTTLNELNSCTAFWNFESRFQSPYFYTVFY